MLAFHRSLYVEHRDRVMPVGFADYYGYKNLDRALEDDVDAMLSNDETVVLLAETSTGDVVGYITGHVERDTRRTLPVKGVVEDWFVREGLRGAGTGKLLMTRLVDVFREVGCHVVESTTWPFNEGARKSHRALGFDEVEVKFRKKLT